MQQQFFQLAPSFIFRMKSRRQQMTSVVFFYALLLFSVYGASRVVTSLFQTHPNQASQTKINNAQGSKTAAIRKRKSAATLTSITTATYEAKLYWAIPFVPRQQSVGLIQAEPGNRFVLLDMAVRNTTTNRHVNMGDVLLTAKVRDEQGREYFSNPLVIAAFNLEYPNRHHHALTTAMKGVLAPGAEYRTVIFGFEAPVEMRNFLLQMEEEHSGNEYKLYEAPFGLKQDLAIPVTE
jgi:hypothetical protein